MWLPAKLCNRRASKFFRLILGNDDLKNMMLTNFAMAQHHGYSISELENMLPYERDIYISLVADHVQKEKQRREQAKANQQA